MLFSRMLLLQSFITTLVLAAGTSCRESNLTGELTGFVPSCAEDCFITFLQANYGYERGHEIPSLDELCSTDGDTDFTVGEGAVQCIAAERSVGGCSERDANSSVIHNAHQMCADHPGAIPPTHAAITATLMLPPAGEQGPVSIPFPSRTSRVVTTSPTAELPSTLVVDTQSSTSIPSSPTPDVTASSLVSADVTVTRTAANTSASPAGGASGGGGDDDDNVKIEKKSLTSLQKAGIAVGVIGSSVLALGVCLLIRSRRAKRRRQQREWLTDTPPPDRESWGYRSDKSRGAIRPSGSDTLWMANQGPGPDRPADRPPYRPPKGSFAAPLAASGGAAATPMSARAAASRAAAFPPAPAGSGNSPGPFAPWRPSAIGLAISPPGRRTNSKTPAHSSSTRPLSKLLPAKPTLSLSTVIPAETSSDATRDGGVYAQTPARIDRGPEIVVPSPVWPRVASHPPVLPNLSIPQKRADDFLGLADVATAKPRESTMTEFEEDGRASASLSPEGQIWRPPSMAPQSTATYYVADKSGNWVLGDAQTATAPPIQAFELEGTAASAGASAGAAGAADQSSSTEPPSTLHLQGHVVPRALFSATGGNPRHRQASASAQRSSSTARRSTCQLRPAATSAGSSSATTITTSSEGDKDKDNTTTSTTTTKRDLLPPPNCPQMHLSPVAESPRSRGTGRSPVSYPKIPATTPASYSVVRDGGGTSGLVDALATGRASTTVPPKPATTCPYPGSDGPNAPFNDKQARVQPAIVPSSAPSRIAPRGPRLPRHMIPDAATVRTGSPPTMMRSVRANDDQDDDRAMLPSARPHESIRPLPTPQRSQVHPQQRSAMPTWIPGLPAHPHPQRRPQPTSSSSSSSSNNTTTTTTMWLPPQARQVNRTLMETELHHHHQQQQHQDHPSPRPDTVHTAPNYPSLHRHPHHYSRFHPQPQQTAPPYTATAALPPTGLAQRLGRKRAPNLSISTNHHHQLQPSAPTSQPNWHHERGNGGPLHLSPEPISAHPHHHHHHHHQQQQQQQQHPPGDLPSTPNWLPTLTPTRHGADLYLNVQ